MNRILSTALAALALLSACKEGTRSSKNTPTEKKVELPSFSAEGKILLTYTTAKQGDYRLSKSRKDTFRRSVQALESDIAIFVNPNKRFQSLLGIGGAITDASAEVLSALSDDKQEELLNAYFGDNGLSYSIIRTSIHSCDFSSGSFTYVSDADKDLKTFDIEHDRKFRFPIIKRALAKAGEDIIFYASPWSPPAFMKSNGDMLQGGKLLPEFYNSWALYYAKFIEAYEKEGIPVWGITIQNEPMAVQRWESCIYTAEEERDFLKNHLGPVLEREGYGDKKIVVWDHNRDLINQRANVIFEDPEASKYAWGIGFHWYENWAGGEPMFENLQKVKEAFPEKELLFTEGCNERFDSSKYEYWPNAERYGRSMINDFNAGTVGWTDWNILLNQEGGPNHVGNLCFAPVHADLNSGDLIYTPSYYYIGHFSKFIRPGAKRLSTVSSRSHLLSTSFINPDQSVATVVMNPTDNNIEYRLMVGTQESLQEIPAHGIQTLVY
ncbi:glycosyl hydrolase [Salibacteraceae bacterium]|jgi:glucosylceramidase|nr:glycosyl hydrolase [Salibacteraceae bacterium]